MPVRPLPRPAPRTVFVTGANGYIGSAVCRSFARAGYRVYGMIRRASSAPSLWRVEATPVQGSFDDASWVDTLISTASTFDVLVNCVESFPDYEAHYEKVIMVMLRLARASNDKGVRPLLLWTSGCKDYGLGSVRADGSVPLHTEETVEDPPTEAIRQRAQTSRRIYEHADVLDGVLLRPTSVYGYSSSYYATLMDYADDQRGSGAHVLPLPVDPETPMHALHVDDCAEAYVALAEHGDRSAVADQTFNISSYRYETAREIGEALAKGYGFRDGVVFPPVDEAGDQFPASVAFTFGFPQWVASEKIRNLTGWRDRRALFTEDIDTYRRSYEAEKARGHENIDLARDRLAKIGTMEVGRE
ncbi:Nucleoside-diphosphate-sugar epimerase [Geosmithia morbida]|uniref:Nucleoside-diphosphate-sugar epimerase n=1 Tax=Geosmithia morbida TaxID=1094350 RepID=A0A9P4YPM8_9HYPO|nr:Nucleoside-diphosphate-sugar epimerase [Geosmithia morbida]KAF4120816.1 Nucleoside-diphosphate-sugar epimerase [Geosmithia morbida]